MSVHVVSTGEPICPEAEKRAALTDEEFWPYVLLGVRQGEVEDGPDLDDDVSISYQNDPCPECGEYGACAYDAEGRAMTHITTRDGD